ncbi:MAG: DNA polymerase I [Thermoanaerobaculia bacterium]
MASRGRLFLIDGSSNIYRSYYAIRGLTNSSGMSTNAVYGFIQILRKLLKDQKPDAIAVAFDVSGPTFRHKQFEDYKKDRKPMPDDLSIQIPFIREVCEGFRIPILEIPEYEADDVIGSVACRARDAGFQVVIATADKDFFQLVGDGIQMYHTGRDTLYDAPGATEAFGVAPALVPDVMGIWGDAIDGIPGVPGIGEKGAKALIGEFGSLDAIYEHLDDVKKASQRNKLEEFRDQAFLSRDLARIRCDLDVGVELESFFLEEPDRERLHQLFSKLEFQSLMQEFLPQAEPLTRDYRAIGGAADLAQFLSGDAPLAIHFQSDPEGAGQPVGVALSSKPGEAVVVPLADHLGGSDETRAAIRKLVESERTLVAHDMKLEMRRLLDAGWPLPRRFEDTMMISYVLNPGAYAHALENVARERLKRDVTTWKELLARVEKLDLGEECCRYIGEKSDLVFELWESLSKEMEAEPALRKIYEEIEIPLIPILGKMEHRGIRIDTTLLGEMSETMGGQIAELEERIYKEAGQTFNINSPAQLGTILFEKLQYPVLKKTQKTKSYSTGVEVLRELASHGYAVPQLILEHRELHKLKSTYVDALPQLVAPDGRVHTSFNQAVAATGRLSSSDPNLQNIPVRTAQGREIRRAFIAEPGNVLIAADYSQIELRILAHMTGDADLIETFARGADIHRTTAARIFGMGEDEVSSEQRRAAKTINFGVLYGMSAFRLSQELGISGAEAKEFIESYFARFPTIRSYLDATLEEARQSGKVTTLFGRVRYIPEIHNRSWTVRGNAERMATNAPIQGTAADLLKLAMIALDRRLEKEMPRAEMLLTVHDEIVLEAPEREADEVARLVQSTMEGVYPLAVPLAVETRWGRSWFEAKG